MLAESMRESGSLWWDIRRSAYAQLGCLRHTFKWGFQKSRDLAFMESKRGFRLLESAMRERMVLQDHSNGKFDLLKWKQTAREKWISAGRSIGDIQ